MCRSEVEPCYAHRVGRARLRQPGVQRAAGGIADLPGVRRGCAARSRPEPGAAASDARERPDGGRPRTRRATRCADERGERGRRDRADDGEHRLLEAERRAAAGRARRLRRRREREPVPAEPEHAGDDQRRDEHRERRVDEQRGHDAWPARARGRRGRSGAIRARVRSDQRPAAMRAAMREHVASAASTAAAACVESPRWSWRNSTTKLSDRDLRREIERRAAREHPDARRRAAVERARSSARLRPVRRLAQRARRRRRRRRRRPPPSAANAASSRPRVASRGSVDARRSRRRSGPPPAGCRARGRARPRRTSPSPRGRWRR